MLIFIMQLKINIGCMALFLAAVRSGDSQVVPMLDRLAWSAPDAHEIAGTLRAIGVKLALGASLYAQTDPFGKMFFNV